MKTPKQNKKITNPGNNHEIPVVLDTNIATHI